ncbi:Pyruvate kinase [Macleaya cordata]|uniref:pyruvate kinase n=1 Tax=Macleaya cordata TaxID=56857 RepID=A0A200QXT3_MACCD|nr:Pyruvate kinase [Macleaya cordata]
MLKSIFLASGNNQCQEDSDVNTVASISHSEVNIKQHVFDYPVNQGNLLDRLKAVHLHVLASEQWNASRLKLCHRNYLVSATNLIHYLALKCLDVEQLQEELSSVGLQNLETINPNVIASIDAGIQMLENLKSNSKANMNSMNLNLDVVGDTLSALEGQEHKKKGDFTITAMRRKALTHRESLLGPLQDGRTTHIMVTVGKEATESETLIGDLLSNGTTIFRINCAHGDPSIWSEIIRRIKRSSHMLEKPCRILMDLAGPKLRTDHMKAGPSVMKISPKKDATGSVIFPAQVWLSHTGSGPPPAHLSPDAVLFVDNQQFLSNLEVGSVLKFSDTRGRKRLLKISKRFPVFAGIGFMAECSRTSYMASGTELYKKGKSKRFSVGHLVNVPAVEQFIRLKIGDLLVISRDPCLTPKVESGGSTVGAPRISCSSSYLFDSVKPGEPIAFDDGKIWGVIQGTSSSEIIVSITHASPKGSKLGSEKSINIPQSEIKFDGLTSKDLLDLEFVAEHADIVGVSFIRDVRDVVVLQQELEKRKLHKLGVVLKIETQSGFEKLPFLILQAMQFPNPLGVMIARGDLAVECGWEKLADIQEEILSICGAAHIPVIWATQVLESLVKSGLPTRAEITDVANGRRASCIMLNKGKYITGAVSTLDSILCSGSKKMKAELKPLLLSSRH